MLNWLFLIFWSSFIFLISSFSHIGKIFPGISVVIVSILFHFTEYVILGFLSFKALRQISFLSKKQILLLVFIFGIVYAISDEYHQSFIPGRDSSLNDVFIDLLGILTIIFLPSFQNIAIRINLYSLAENRGRKPADECQPGETPHL